MNAKQVQRAIDASLSSLRVTDRDRNNIMNQVREGKKMKKKLSAAFVLTMTLVLVATVALAATLLSQDVFKMTMGHTPDNAKALTQYDLGTFKVGDAEITIKEAAYDGMSLYVAYSVRDTKAAELVGKAYDEYGDGIRYPDDADWERYYKLGIRNWADTIWVDGVETGMPQGTTGNQIGGEQPGEIIFYNQYRLDSIDMYLTGKNVEITLPLGAKPENQAEYYDKEKGAYIIPKTGVISFTMDCSSRDQVVTETPNAEMKGKDWDAKITKAVYSPIQMYVTVDWSLHKDVFDAFIAKNGTAHIEDGVKYWDYTAMDVCDDVSSLVLVDGDGKKVFESFDGYYGCEGFGSEQAWYTFPYLEKYPETMYLAPERDGVVDMTYAIPLRSPTLGK